MNLHMKHYPLPSCSITSLEEIMFIEVAHGGTLLTPHLENLIPEVVELLETHVFSDLPFTQFTLHRMLKECVAELSRLPHTQFLSVKKMATISRAMTREIYTRAQLKLEEGAPSPYDQ